jgi:uncharacterized protein DUF3551
MWKVLVAFGILMAQASAPLHAQDSPWCVVLDAFTRNCAYTSYDECTAVANNATSPATGVARCIRNPNYQPPPAAAAKSAPAKPKQR